MTAIAITPPNVAARPLAKAPDGLPEEVLGEKCTYVWKPMLALGEIEHPKLGWTYNVDEREANLLVSEGQRYIANGNKPFLPDKHMDVYDANANNGYIPKLEFKDGVVWGLHQLIGEEARKKAAKNDTSVYIEFNKRDGKGQRYKKVITHNALCPDPVAPGLGGFFAMSQSGMPQFVIALGGYNHGCNQYGCKAGGGGDSEGKDVFSGKSTAERTAICKKAMPSGTKVSSDGSLRWSKSGGYAGKKTISATTAKMQALGFKRDDSASWGSATQGGSVRNENVYKNSVGDEYRHSSFYGGTAGDNRYTMSVTFASDSKSLSHSVAMCGSGEECQCNKCRAARQGDDMKLTPEQLARAEALGLTDIDDDNAADRLLALAEANGKKLAASVSIMDRPADYLLNPILLAKAEKAMSRGISKAAIDKVVASFSGTDKKLAPIAFSQSANGQPVLFDVLDALAENTPSQPRSSFGTQSIALSGGASGESDEDKAITATLQENGLVPIGKN